jgi:mono/diheme cytochrome c family protein
MVDHQEETGSGNPPEARVVSGRAATAAGTRQDEPLYGLLAELESPTALRAAAEVVRDAGYTRWDCYSPFPVHGIDPAMGIKRTVVPLVVFAGGLAGLLGGLALQWWTNAYDWPWLVSGKPFWSLPANIPIAFETTVLLAGFSAFFGMWALNKLPRFWHPLFRRDRFVKVTNNGFFIGVEAADPRFDRAEAEAMLTEAGALAVEACHIDTDPEKRRIPAGLKRFVVVTGLLAVVPFVCVAGARSSKSARPHRHIIPDMDFQPIHRTETATALFEDGRSARPGVAGTVAVGDLLDDPAEDDHFHRGVIVGAPAAGDPGEPAAAKLEWARTFPASVPVNEATMARGRERFDIYCAPCHGVAGFGDGVVHRRVVEHQLANRWTPPLSLHDPKVVRQPHGQLFFTISSGIRTMAGYAAQIAPADRWAIILYLRALQRSQRASTEDVPPEAREDIEDPLPPTQPAGPPTDAGAAAPSGDVAPAPPTGQVAPAPTDAGVAPEPEPAPAPATNPTNQVP